MIFILVHPNLGLCPILTLQDNIFLTQSITIGPPNHWISTTCQQPYWTSNLAIARPTTPLVTTFSSHLLGFYSKRVFMYDCTQIYLSLQKGFPHRKLQFHTAIYNLYQFTNKCRTGSLSLERVETTMTNFSHRDFSLSFSLYDGVNLSSRCSFMSF